MSKETHKITNLKAFRLSLDTWAVIVAFALALAVRLEVLTGVPW